MSLSIILWMMLIHWVADFVMQSNEDAINKNKSIRHLTNHINDYISVWFIAFAILLIREDVGIIFTISFLVITYIAHWITDYFTSKLVTYYFSNKNNHNGFVVIGFDQILHYLQLFLTYKLLK